MRRPSPPAPPGSARRLPAAPAAAGGRYRLAELDLSREDQPRTDLCDRHGISANVERKSRQNRSRITTMAQAASTAAHDWTVPQQWDRYTAAEHALWDRLFQRQSEQLPGRAVPAFLNGLDVLHLCRPGIPDFAELSEKLMKLTGWSVVAVPGLVPDEVFFDHLAHRRFVAGRFIRRPDQIDYLEEPDVFHDVFGHVPLLANPVFGDY